MVTGVSGIPPSLNLSKAIKLRNVEFRPSEPNVKWISVALRTAKSKNLRQITIHLATRLMFTMLRGPVGEITRQEWQDLDHLLVQLWTTRSIRPVFTFGDRGTDSGALVSLLLPELVSKGVVNVV